ncbi:MAG: LacI family DNA-binding transcriptional regulator [Pleomorphochaeta sp.]
MDVEKVSMKDVANKAGVSTATVSHVINDSCPVKEETKKLVNDAIKVLNYKVNPIARKLRSGQSKLIGFVVSNLSHYFYHEIGSAIEKVLIQNGYELLYINSHEDAEKEKKQLELCRLEDLAGIIVIPVNKDWSSIEYLVKGLPLVFIDRKPINIRRDTVMITNSLSAFNLTNELIKRGAKKIAFISSKFDSTFKMRVDGYKDALEQNNFKIDDECIIYGSRRPKVYSELATDPEMEENLDFLLNEKKVDCIISGNDLCAFGAISYFKKRNIKLQKDLLFGTFDNAFWMNNINEEIVLVEQNTRALGEKAANLLLSRINGDTFVYDDYRLETKLVLLKQQSINEL